MKVYKFYANWCVHCKPFSDRIAEVVKDYNLINIDVDEEEYEHFIDKYNIKNVPTLIITDDNDNELCRLSEESSNEEIKAKLASFDEKLRQ